MKKLSWALVLMLFSLCSFSFAQTTDANLVGTVADATGAAVPDASVEITHQATRIKSATRTNANGQYRFNNIPVGIYDVTVTATGFAVANLKNVEIQLSKTSTANVLVQVGTVATSVDVNEIGAVIDTTTAQVQTNYGSQQIVNLPIIESSNSFNGAINLSLLSAGVSSNGGVGQGTGPSVGGQRPMNNNFMIEGVDNNNKAITGPLVYVPTEATEQFTLLQNQYGWEFGHSTGGQFNTVVKSGSNEIHGSLYEYFQNRNLNALDASYTNAGIFSYPRFDQNRLGASVGGPIKKNKLFYFGNFEYSPLGTAYTPSFSPSAPTAGGYALLDRMSNISKTNYDVFKKFVPAAPVANDFTTVNGVKIPIGVLPISGSFYNNFYAGVASMDYDATASNHIRGRFVWNRMDALDNAATLPAFWTNL